VAGAGARRFRRWLAVGGLLALVALGLGSAGYYLHALYHFRAGRSSLERFHGREAGEHLDAYLRVWPRDREALFLAARAARLRGAFDEAEQYLADCHGWDGHADDLTLERALLRAARGDVDASSKFGRAMVARDHPATPLILEALASGLLRMFRLPEAKQFLDEWLRREPDQPQAHFLMGRFYALAENRPDAVASYRRVLELDPERDDARSRLSGLLLELGQAPEALPHLEYLRRKLPEDPAVQTDLAQCLDQLGRPAEAVELLDDALARQPDFSPALAQRGKLALRAGQLAEADAWLRQACALEPGGYEAHYQFQQCLFRQGKAAEAEEEAARLQQIEEDVRQLQDIVRKRLPEKPNDPELRAQLGSILLRAGATEEGVRWLQAALEKDSLYGPAHQALADHYRRAGQLGLAERHQALARRTQPPGPPVR
jgi:tetratricopeptide (TPR) repeat protein